MCKPLETSVIHDLMEMASKCCDVRNLVVLVLFRALAWLSWTLYVTRSSDNKVHKLSCLFNVSTSNVKSLNYHRFFTHLYLPTYTTIDYSMLLSKCDEDH